MFGAVGNASAADFRGATLFKHPMNEYAESSRLRGFGMGRERSDEIWNAPARKFPQGKHRKCRKAVVREKPPPWHLASRHTAAATVSTPFQKGEKQLAQTEWLSEKTKASQRANPVAALEVRMSSAQTDWRSIDGSWQTEIPTGWSRESPAPLRHAPSRGDRAGC